MRRNAMNRTLRLAAHLTMVAASAIGATRALAQEAVPAERGIVLKTARLSLDGKSTLHAFTAATTTIELRSAFRGALASDCDWPAVLRPEAVKSFEVRIPVKS